MSSPWAKLSIPGPSNLKDVMLEESTKGNKKCLEVEEINLQSDTRISQQYDEEYNESLRTTKEKQNYTSVLFPKSEFQMKESNFSEVSSDEEPKNINEKDSQHSDEVISKYDVKAVKVCNSLKLCSKREQSKREELHYIKEDNVTERLDLDFSTRSQLHKLIKKHKLRVDRVINESREAVVLHANIDPSRPNLTLPKECAIKIYKTTCVDSIGKQSVRRISSLWAERELHNLYRLQKAGIPCPQPVAVKQNVLLMSFIEGNDYRSAPRLRYAITKTEEYDLAYNQVVETMKNLYNKAKLIHGDLCEHNILWHNKQCYFIDVSQSVERTDTDASRFLFKDCENITKFFHKKIPNMKTAQELFIEIAGFDYFDTKAVEETEWQKIMEVRFEQQQVITGESDEKDIIDLLLRQNGIPRLN